MKVSEEGTWIRLTWNTNDEQEVEKARDYFMKLTKQGWIAAKRKGDLKRILDFNPECEEIWFIPLTEGG